MAQSFPLKLARHEGLQQFVKFCVIGATSAVIDVGLFNLLVVRGGDPTASRVLSFTIAVANGFIWNSLWTFRGHGTGSKHGQFLKFFGINVIGLILNLLIMNGLFYAFTGRFPHKPETDRLHLNAGLLVAIVIVSCWNFLANKRWTFNSPPVADSSR
jgi:putative flippase GtrA